MYDFLRLKMNDPTRRRKRKPKASASLTRGVVACALALAITSYSEAAFLIEAHASGLGNDNFELGESLTGARESTPSNAVGLQATNSIFGGEGGGGEPHTYWFRFTPGRDEDNLLLSQGLTLGSRNGAPGDGNRATGLRGGQSGRYKVYITSPQSTNVNGGPSVLTLEQEGESLVVEIDLNNERTGPDTAEGPAFVGGANNAWYLLGAVDYFANRTYEISMQSTLNTFVSQRVHGILWEYAPFTPGDFNEDTLLDANDIDLLTAAIRGQTSEPVFDLNADGLVDFRDREVWVDEIRRTYFGDANLDGEFSSGDFVQVFVAGEYEDSLRNNSVWSTGDWNGDGEFNSTDFVSAFRSGGFELGPRATVPASVPEPTAICLPVVLIAGFARRSTHR